MVPSLSQWFSLLDCFRVLSDDQGLIAGSHHREAGDCALRAEPDFASNGQLVCVAEVFEGMALAACAIDPRTEVNVYRWDRVEIPIREMQVQGFGDVLVSGRSLPRLGSKVCGQGR